VNEFVEAARDMINAEGAPVLIVHASGKKTRTKAVFRNRTEKVVANGTLSFVTFTEFLIPALKVKAQSGEQVVANGSSYVITQEVDTLTPDGLVAFTTLTVAS